MKRLTLLAFTAFGLTLLAVPAAQAFTFENQDATAAAGQNFIDLSQPKLTDPDAQHLQSGGTPGVYNFGNGGTLQFGTRGPIGSFDQRYDPSNMFDPYARSGRY